ncbi:MAG TPA: hypothetical protein VIR54_09065 [Vicinamibacterales bacterium]|jgi:hypothetical protein
MSDALERIEEYAQAFRDGIARCEGALFNRADLLDAYDRLSRLRDRYLKEKPHLTPTQRLALAKVFEDDRFIEGMLNARQIGEHVTKRGPVVTIRTADNAPITFDAVQSSAMAYFAGPLVQLPDVHERLHEIDHLGQLREAEKRIDAAIQRARS